jgi:hypothetical protein
VPVLLGGGVEVGQGRLQRLVVGQQLFVHGLPGRALVGEQRQHLLRHVLVVDFGVCHSVKMVRE